MCFLNLGKVFFFFGKYEEVKDCFENVFLIIKEIGSWKIELLFYGGFGNVFFFIGDYVKVKEY